ncbi:VWA domain-containing protein [Myxococcaceae bacterium JPH2]|nr:VWA domain-containing protein [Myxococcaceae bacterium JPH2]
MKRTLLRLLLSVLAVPMMSACGPEAEQALAPAAVPDVAVQAQSLNEVALADASPKGERPLVRFIQAPDAKGSADGDVKTLGPERYGLILLDRSGSMTAIRKATGNSRCKDAKKQSLLQLENMFDPNIGNRTRVAVVSFAGTVVTKLTIGYVDKATAKAALDALGDETCSGGTPLADAMCFSIDYLAAQDPGNSTSMYVATDGEENASTGVCSGPSGDPVLNTSSWPYKVYAKATASLVKMDTAYWTGSSVLNLLPSEGAPSATTTACTTAVLCEDKLFSSLATVTGGEYRRANDVNAAYPCAAGACPAPFAGTRGNLFAFNVQGTSGGTVNTANTSIYLRQGETLNVGTCGVNGATGTGDTTMRLFNPSGTQVALNDDGCGLLSKITYVVPATGTYQVRIGCFANNPCGGTLAYTVGSSFTFNVSNTNGGTMNTANAKIYVRPGQRVQVGTCGLTGASGTGDTIMRLFDPATPPAQVAINDDACGGSLSNFVYNVPDTIWGDAEIRVGCYATTACSGTVSYFITDVQAP